MKYFNFNTHILLSFICFLQISPTQAQTSKSRSELDKFQETREEIIEAISSGARTTALIFAEYPDLNPVKQFAMIEIGEGKFIPEESHYYVKKILQAELSRPSEEYKDYVDQQGKSFDYTGMITVIVSKELSYTLNFSIGDYFSLSKSEFKNGIRVGTGPKGLFILEESEEMLYEFGKLVQDIEWQKYPEEAREAAYAVRAKISRDYSVQMSLEAEEDSTAPIDKEEVLKKIGASEGTKSVNAEKGSSEIDTPEGPSESPNHIQLQNQVWIWVAGSIVLLGIVIARVLIVKKR